MGFLKDLGRSTLGGELRAVANRQLAIRQGKAVAIQQGITNRRAERTLKVQEDRLAIDQRKADAEFRKWHDPQPLTKLIGAVRHPKGKQFVTETMQPFMKTELTSSAFNMKQWGDAYNDTLPQKKVGWWTATQKELQFANDNFGKKGDKANKDIADNVQKALDNNVWVLNRPLKTKADIEEALQSANNELLRLDPVVEKARLKRRADAEDARGALTFEEKERIKQADRIALEQERAKKDTRTGLQKEFDRFKKNNPNYKGSIIQFNKDKTKKSLRERAVAMAGRDTRLIIPGKTGRTLEQLTNEYMKALRGEESPAQNQLTVEQARAYLDRANGNRKLAEQMARQDGKTF